MDWLIEIWLMEATNETVYIQTHEYENTVPYIGCKVCRFGPGSLQHNTTQETWQVSRLHPYVRYLETKLNAAISENNSR
jgi:hypothetical protein